MPFTIEHLIDALLLALHTDDELYMSTAKEVLTIYRTEMKETPQVPATNLYDMYADLLSSVLAQNIKISDRKAIDIFLLKLKTNKAVIADPEVYNDLRNMLTDITEVSENRQEEIARKLANTILAYRNNKIVRQMTWRIAKIQTAMNSADYQDKLLEELDGLCNTILLNNRESVEKMNRRSTAHTVAVVNFGDKENIVKALKVYEETNIKHRLHTGWQGLDRALSGGFALGSSIVLNALAHSAKSLMLLNFVRWIVTLNDAPIEYQNPACILYSLENETPQNLKLLFDAMYTNKYHQLPPDDWDFDKIANFCMDESSTKGWKLYIERRVGGHFSYTDLVASYNEYVAHGVTPLVVVIDYMNMMNKKDFGHSDRTDLLIRELYTNVRNFLSSKNCTLITAHQLNRKASELVRTSPCGAVKKFGSDMLSDSTDPQREVDIAIYQHKEKDTNGRWWLTFKLDKDRYHHKIPDSHKYFAYMFDPELGILDDVGGNDMSSTDINAAPVDGETGTEQVGDVVTIERLTA